MSKTETLRQLSAAANENRLAHLANQIEAVQESRIRSVDALAEILEPLAQAMAALTDETRQTLIEIRRESADQAYRFTQQTEAAATSWKAAAAEAQSAANTMHQASRRMEWIHYALAAVIGLLTAVLVTVFWRWLAPPSIENRLSPEAVAEHLKPLLSEALKRSKSK